MRLRWADKIALLWAFLLLLGLNVLGQPGAFAVTYGTAAGWWGVIQVLLIGVLPIWIILRVVAGNRPRRY